MLCSGCKNVFYCNRDCQKKHWTSHKNDCKNLKELPYRIERSPVRGRFLVATKDIPAGDLIFSESPIICGPKQLTKPVCLGCHKDSGEYCQGNGMIIEIDNIAIFLLNFW